MGIHYNGENESMRKLGHEISRNDELFGKNKSGLQCIRIGLQCIGLTNEASITVMGTTTKTFLIAEKSTLHVSLSSFQFMS